MTAQLGKSLRRRAEAARRYAALLAEDAAEAALIAHVQVLRARFLVNNGRRRRDYAEVPP